MGGGGTQIGQQSMMVYLTARTGDENADSCVSAQNVVRDSDRHTTSVYLTAAIISSSHHRLGRQGELHHI